MPLPPSSPSSALPPVEATSPHPRPCTTQSTSPKRPASPARTLSTTTPGGPPPPPPRSSSTFSSPASSRTPSQRPTPRTRPHPAHPALLDAHAHRAHNLDLLDALDDETLAALANELREIGLGKARGAGAGVGAGVGVGLGLDAPAGGGGGAAGGEGPALGRSTLGEGSGSRTRVARRATTTAATAVRPAHAQGGVDGPPPAYSAVDPLSRASAPISTTSTRSSSSGSATGTGTGTGSRSATASRRPSFRGAPLAVVHERRMSAPSGERCSG